MTSTLKKVRDVLRKIAGTNKLAALNKPVSDIHTPASRMVYTKPHDKLTAVRMVMRSHGLRNLPVLSHRSGTVAQAPLGAPDAPRTVLGILTHKAMADYASFLADGVGGKKAALGLEQRRGLPGRVLGPQSLKAVGGVDPAGQSQVPAGEATRDPSHAYGQVPRNYGGVVRGAVLDVSVGAAAKPHPFKSPDGVANTRRDYGPGQEVRDRARPRRGFCRKLACTQPCFFIARFHCAWGCHA